MSYGNSREQHGQMSFDELVRGQFDDAPSEAWVDLRMEYPHIEPSSDLGRIGIRLLGSAKAAERSLSVAEGSHMAAVNAMIGLGQAANKLIAFDEMYQAISVTDMLHPHEATYAELVRSAELAALENLVDDKDINDPDEIVSTANLIFEIKDAYAADDDSHFQEIPRELDCY